MKLSCIPVSYFEEIIKNKKSILQWAAEAKEIGFDYIDLSILFFFLFDEEYFVGIYNKLERLNIRIAIINSYTDFTHPNAKKRKSELNKVKDYIKAAEILGAKYLRVTAGQAYPQTSINDGIKWAIEGFEKASQLSEGTSVGLVFENHSKPGIWDYPDFSFQTGNFLEIYRIIRYSQIKILFDTANTLAYGDDPLKVLDEVSEDLACIHAADINAKGSFDPVVIGTGIVPFREIFKKLKEIGFNKIISIEEASNTGGNGIKIAERFIRNTWNILG